MLVALLVVGILAAGVLVTALIGRSGRSDGGPGPGPRAGRAPDVVEPDVRGAVNKNSWMLGGQGGG